MDPLWIPKSDTLGTSLSLFIYLLSNLDKNVYNFGMYLLVGMRYDRTSDK